MAAIGAATVLFEDDFDRNGPIDASRWKPNVGPGSFYGNTQVRDFLPSAEGGVLRLQLDTYNPTGNPGNPTFYGSEAITVDTFPVGDTGIAFEVVARLAQDQRGVIGGAFPYLFKPATGLHDEIDWEWMPNRTPGRPPTKIQSNIYVDEPFGNGHPALHDLPDGGTLTEFHTYRIEWLPTAVRWLIADGDDWQVVRTETRSPDGPMELHLNFWGPPPTWDTADPSFRATGDPGQNRSVFFEVDSVAVERLAAGFGTRGADRLVGDEADNFGRGGRGTDLLAGGAGDDTAHGNVGRDTLLGGAGDDVLLGGSGNDTMAGGRGEDVLRGGIGNDVLLGGGGDDRILNGGRGNDVVDGGRGGDRLRGGDGADTFRFGSVEDGPGRPDRDVILDYDLRRGDRVDLSRIDADATTAGDDAFRFIGEEAFGGSAGELRYEATQRGVLLAGDVDGDGTADFEVFIRDVSAESDADIIL